MGHADSPIDKLGQSPQFKSFMRLLAIVGGIATVIGLIMKLLGLEGGSPMLIVGVGMLAVVAFLLGWIFPCPHSIDDVNYVGGMQPVWRFAMTLTGWSLSTGLMGMLFMLMHWPGGMKMLILGCGSLAVSCIAWLYYFKLSKKSINQ